MEDQSNGFRPCSRGHEGARPGNSGRHSRSVKDSGEETGVRQHTRKYFTENPDGAILQSATELLTPPTSNEKMERPAATLERFTALRRPTSPDKANRAKLSKAPAPTEPLWDEFDDFPGARILNAAFQLNMTFREAVEKFIKAKYSAQQIKQLTGADIYRDFPKLHDAYRDYRKRFRVSPFNIRSERELVQSALEQLFEDGIDSLSQRQRTSVRRKIQREDIGQPNARPQKQKQTGALRHG
jgi:hypothetical protein